MSDSYSTTERFEKAFDKVTEVYIDLKSLDGIAWKQTYGKPHTHGPNPRLVIPSDQDFICDVELAIKSALPYEEDVRSCIAIITGIRPVGDATKARIKRAVGRELLRRRINGNYFKGKEVTRG